MIHVLLMMQHQTLLEKSRMKDELDRSVASAKSLQEEVERNRAEISRLEKEIKRSWTAEELMKKDLKSNISAQYKILEETAAIQSENRQLLERLAKIEQELDRSREAGRVNLMALQYDAAEALSQVAALNHDMYFLIIVLILNT